MTTQPTHKTVTIERVTSIRRYERYDIVVSPDLEHLIANLDADEPDEALLRQLDAVVRERGENWRYEDGDECDEPNVGLARAGDGSDFVYFPE